MQALRRLPPTAEVELLAVAVAAERFAGVLQDETPPHPDVAAVVCAIIRANRRRNDFASRN